MRAKPSRDHKFIKARVLDSDGDLVWGVIEVPMDDKRKAFDPATGKLHNSTDVAKGNPMADKPVGENDVEVTGL